MKVTTKMVEKIRQMNADLKNDRDIAAELGIAHETVRKYRSLMNLPTVDGKERNKKLGLLKQYTVYDADGLCVAFGTAEECAKAMGITTNVFYIYVRSRRPKRKWDIVCENGE